jgi:hypothetical protein
MKVVHPRNLKPLSRRLRFDEQAKIVDIQGTEEIVCGPSPVGDKTRSNDVSDVRKATFKKIQRRFAYLPIISVTAQGIDSIEEPS